MVMRRDGLKSNTRTYSPLNSYGFPAPYLSDQSPMLFVDRLTRPWYQGEALREPRLRHHLRISIILLLRQHGQMPRAILLASVIATSIFGLRFSIVSSQLPLRTPNRVAAVITDIAPVISRLQISFWPIFETLPSRTLPSVACCIGTRPSQAARSRPRSNSYLEQ